MDGHLDEEQRAPRQTRVPEIPTDAPLHSSPQAAILDDDDFLPESGGRADATRADITACPACSRPTSAGATRCRVCGEEITVGRDGSRLPGPGVPEVFVWITGVVVLQVFASVAVSMGLLLFYGLTAGWGELQKTLKSPKQLVELMSDQMVPIFGGVQAIMIPAAILAVSMRLGRERRRRLPLRPVRPGHVLLTGLLLVFLIPFCSQLLIVTTGLWNNVIERLPGLAELEAQGSLKNVESLAQDASLPFLLVAIAVVPAVWEELVFRGLIGRGLVARLGPVSGVLVTAVLFALIHLFPPQVVALIPLAVAIHVAYLATRSIWVPIAIHLLNNAVGVAVIKALQKHPKAAARIENYTPAPELVIALGSCVAMTIWLMWRTRVEYYLPDGTVWDPGYMTTDLPPSELNAEPRCRPLDRRTLVPVVAGIALLMVAFGALVFRRHLAG